MPEPQTVFLSGEQPIVGIDQDWGALDSLRVPESVRSQRLGTVRELGGIVTEWDVLLPPLTLQDMDMQALRERIEDQDLFDIDPVLPLHQLGRITVNASLGCWEIPAYIDEKNRARYPIITSKQLAVTGEGAHRVFYRQLVGAILPGNFIDHRCLNKCCVYPRHLQDVTPSLNTRRGRIDSNAKLQPGLIVEA